MKNISLDFGNSDIQKAYLDSDDDVDFNARENKETIVEQSEPTVFDASYTEQPQESKTVDFAAI